MRAGSRGRRRAPGGKPRRRIPRRRLHVLRIDIAAAVFAFVAVPVVAWLAMEPPARAPRAPEGAALPFAVGIAAIGAPAPSPAADPFAPWAPGAGDRALLPDPAPAPPQDATAAPEWPLPSGNSADRIPLAHAAGPFAATLAAFTATGAAAPPSPGPFATPDPLPPLPPPAKPSGEALLFRSAGWVLPIIVVNSPESGTPGVSAIERAILSEIRQPAAEEEIQRVNLPLPQSGSCKGKADGSPAPDG